LLSEAWDEHHFVEELPAFWEQHWEPLLNGNSAENSLLELRNMMAHTSRFRDEDAQRLLEAHRERFGKAIDATEVLVALPLGRYFV
jgi:hypothetical protein